MYGLVADGASYNLSEFKALAGLPAGPCAYSTDPEHSSSVQAWFENPFEPGLPVALIPCPSHLLKVCKID